MDHTEKKEGMAMKIIASLVAGSSVKNSTVRGKTSFVLDSPTNKTDTSMFKQRHHPAIPRWSLRNTTV